MSAGIVGPEQYRCLKMGAPRALRGRNTWASCTVLEATVELGAPAVCARELPGFEARLRRLLPQASLVRDPGDTLAEVLERVTLALQIAAGCAVSFSRTVVCGEQGDARVVVEYGEEQVGREALDTARRLIDAALADQDFDVPAAVQALRALDENVRLGPSTGAIVSAARARGIPVRRLNDGSLVQLGWGVRQHRILAAETDRTSAIAESIAQDKELTKTLLRSVGVPVSQGSPAADADEAWSIARELGGPVVVKPQCGSQGRGVAVNLTSREQVVAAFAAAREHGASILVERFAPGFDHRLLVIGGKVVAAARREPPQVFGDGVHTIEQLVAIENADPRRGEDHATCLSKMRLDAIGLAVLAEQGLTPASVPPAGARVALRGNANLSTGGSAIDVTDLVHPEVAARAVDAARIVGLDVAGIDVICLDISRPLEVQDGVVVEVNAAPGFRMHLQPSSGKARPVGEAVVATMFEEGDDGRIPLFAISGTNGKTTTARLIAHILKSDGKRVGMTCTDGIFLGDRRLESGDCSGPKSARAVLLNPEVDVAVLETARGGILREGLGFDRCDVAVMTNLGTGDHLGLNGISTVEQLAAVKRTVVESVAPGGWAVLNAADPLTAAMAAKCPGRIIYFACDQQAPVLARHRAEGGRVVYVDQGAIVAAEGNSECRIVELTSVPMTQGGLIGFQVENALASAAALWAAGVNWEIIRGGLSTFVGDSRQAPARFNVLEQAGATIIVDYGHNADALTALVEAIDRMPHRRRLVVFCSAGDRRDADILRHAEILGNGFDGVVLFEDACNRGRADGELTALTRRGLANCRRVSEIVEARGETRAIEAGLGRLRAGDLILLLVDQVESSLEFIQALIAKLSPGKGGASASPLSTPPPGGKGCKLVA